MLLVLIGLSYCVKEEPPPKEEEPTAKTTNKEESKTEEEQPATDIAPIIYNPDLNPDLTWGSVSEIDGNIYKTIQIGTQTWMAEKLKTTRYNTGSQIPNVTGDDDWADLITSAYRWYNNDLATYKNMYGALYNWYTVKTGKLCSTGWHVPSDDEWKQLGMTLGMTQAEADSWWGEDYGDIGRDTDQGTQMKATIGWNDWEGIYGNGTNTSGFSGLPGGETDWSGKFEIEGYCVSWWSSTIEVAYQYWLSGAGIKPPCVASP